MKKTAIRSSEGLVNHLRNNWLYSYYTDYKVTLLTQSHHCTCIGIKLYYRLQINLIQEHTYGYNTRNRNINLSISQRLNLILNLSEKYQWIWNGKFFIFLQDKYKTFRWSVKLKLSCHDFSLSYDITLYFVMKTMFFFVSITVCFTYYLSLPLITGDLTCLNLKKVHVMQEEKN